METVSNDVSWPFLSNPIHNYNYGLELSVNLVIITCAAGERAPEKRCHVLLHNAAVLVLFHRRTTSITHLDL